MRKTIQVIIAKQTVSEGYYIQLKGADLNPDFKRSVSRRIDNYPLAYEVAHTVANALLMAFKEAVTVRVVSDKYAMEDTAAYTETMAFNPIPLEE